MCSHVNRFDDWSRDYDQRLAHLVKAVLWTIAELNRFAIFSEVKVEPVQGKVLFIFNIQDDQLTSLQRDDNVQVGSLNLDDKSPYQSLAPSLWIGFVGENYNPVKHFLDDHLSLDLHGLIKPLL